MSDNQTTQSDNSYASKNILMDRNKSSEQYIKDAEKFYIIPILIREKFPDLVKLIIETESMDLEEREYWLQIMPIMSEEQTVKFRSILVKEKEQLSKIDGQYNSEISRISDKHSAILDEAKLKKRLDTLKAEEKEADDAEVAQEEDLLKQLEGL